MLIENLQAIDEQQLLRRFPISVKKSLLHNSPEGHNEINTNVQGYLEFFWFEGGHPPSDGKAVHINTISIYGKISPPSEDPVPRTAKRSENDAPQVLLTFAASVAIASKGQWKLRNGEGKRTLLDIHAVRSQQVLELGSGCAMGSSKALKHSLQQYTKRVDEWSGVKAESNSTPIDQADVNKLHNSEKVKAMFMESLSNPLAVLFPSSSPLQFSKVKLWTDYLQGLPHCVRLAKARCSVPATHRRACDEDQPPCRRYELRGQGSRPESQGDHGAWYQCQPPGSCLVGRTQ